MSEVIGTRPGQKPPNEAPECSIAEDAIEVATNEATEKESISEGSHDKTMESDGPTNSAEVCVPEYESPPLLEVVGSPVSITGENLGSAKSEADVHEVGTEEEQSCDSSVSANNKSRNDSRRESASSSVKSLKHGNDGIKSSKETIQRPQHETRGSQTSATGSRAPPKESPLPTGNPRSSRRRDSGGEASRNSESKVSTTTSSSRGGSRRSSTIRVASPTPSKGKKRRRDGEESSRSSVSSGESESVSGYESGDEESGERSAASQKPSVSVSQAAKKMKGSNGPSSSSSKNTAPKKPPPVSHGKIDVNYYPSVGEFVWTKIDKTRSVGLAVVVRVAKENPKFTASEFEKLPQVSCQKDGSDRYVVAFLNDATHSFPPRHHLIRFDPETAIRLRCMTAQKAKLTAWDREKRVAINDVIAFLNKKGSLENSHNSQLCYICCKNGVEDAFWKRVGQTRGDIHIKVKEERKKKEELKREEQQKREELKKEEQQKKEELKKEEHKKEQQKAAKATKMSTRSRAAAAAAEVEECDKHSESTATELDDDEMMSDDEEDDDSRSGDDDDDRSASSVHSSEQHSSDEEDASESGSEEPGRHHASKIQSRGARDAPSSSGKGTKDNSKKSGSSPTSNKKKKVTKSSHCKSRR